MRLLERQSIVVSVCSALLAVFSIVAPSLFIPAVFAQSDTEFSLQELTSIATHGPWPGETPPDPGNELSGLTWAEQLGESLFFDQSLSANQSLSCATCHSPALGFSDGQQVAIGLEKGVRNTQGLLDIGLQRWFGWGGGADSLWAASIRPLLRPDEMGNSIAALAATLRENPTFSKAILSRLPEVAQSVGTEDIATDYTIASLYKLGDSEVVVLAAKSIAAYMRTLRSQNSRFDQFRDAIVNHDANPQASYSDSEKRGLKIFIGEANCRSCHFGANFSNGEFHDTGRPFFTGVGKIDPGRYMDIKRVREDQFNLLGAHSVNSSDKDKLKTSEVKLSQVNWGQWRTPSLRNLTLTGPYMHDGSLATLRDVVDAYADIDITRLHSKGESILKPLDLDDGQRNDLVNFLRSLSVQQ